MVEEPISYGGVIEVVKEKIPERVITPEAARILENPFEGSKKVQCRYCMAEWYIPRDVREFKCPICGNVNVAA